MHCPFAHPWPPASLSFRVRQQHERMKAAALYIPTTTRDLFRRSAYRIGFCGGLYFVLAWLWSAYRDDRLFHGYRTPPGDHLASRDTRGPPCRGCGMGGPPPRAGCGQECPRAGGGGRFLIYSNLSLAWGWPRVRMDSVGVVCVRE